MITFDVNDKIVTIKDGELRRGVIKYVYDVYPPIFAVEFEDGTVEKVRYADLAHEPKTETPETEPVEKPEITITPDEFKDISARIIATEAKDPILAISFAVIVGKIHKALFVDSWEHDNFYN